MDYSREIAIDRNDLDTELVKQPSLFLEVAQEYAQAISVRDSLKEAIDVARARVELRIRREAAEEDRKITEAGVKAEVELDKTYRRAMEAWLTAKEAADQLAAAKEAFAQRAFVLKDLCGLYVAGYFSTTSVRGRDATDVQQENYENRRKEMARQRRRL
jgi:GDP-D-mannose dehydratase